MKIVYVVFFFAKHTCEQVGPENSLAWILDRFPNSLA
jgi:hypothetical protein